MSLSLFRRPKLLLWLAALAVANALGVLVATLPSPAADHLRDSVFRIRNFSQAPDYSSPWKYSAGNSAFGTGFYIGHGRILTNAHVVSDARFLTVQRSDGRTAAAKTSFIAHDADLAVVTVADEAFLADTEPLRFGALPSLRSPVYTLGFPLGGEKISITEGVVSRIDYRMYVHSGHYRHLLVQVDSAINPGNSGGPVVQGNRVVGVAFQVNTAAQGTGYIVPTPVIRRFLGDIDDGVYDGHPGDGLTTQAYLMGNAATAAFFRVPHDQSGVLVTHISPSSPFAGKLERGDVVTGVAGHAIDADGRVVFDGERVDFKVYYDLLQVGQTVTLDVIRAGTARAVAVVAAPEGRHYSPARIFPEAPVYLVFGGLVFEPMTRNYLEIYGDDWSESAPPELRFLHRFWEFEPAFSEAAAPVVLAARLPHAVNSYIDVPTGSVLTKVNGVRIRGLDQLRSLLAGLHGEFVQLEFWRTPAVAVLSRPAALAADDAIAKTYRVAPTRWLMSDEAKLHAPRGAP